MMGMDHAGKPCCVLDAPLDDDDAGRLAALLKALADPVRLKIVSIIAASDSGEVCTCDLPQLLGKSQPTTSHHLKLLTESGLLTREQRGKWAWFRLRLDAMAEIRDALGQGD